MLNTELKRFLTFVKGYMFDDEYIARVLKLVGIKAISIVYPYNFVNL